MACLTSCAALQLGGLGRIERMDVRGPDELVPMYLVKALGNMRSKRLRRFLALCRYLVELLMVDMHIYSCCVCDVAKFCCGVGFVSHIVRRIYPGASTYFRTD